MTCPGSHAQPNKMVLKEGASLVAQLVKNLPAMQETWVSSLGWEDSLEKGMATHSSILAWRIPMNRGAWWATLHGVAKSRTQLEQLSIYTWDFPGGASGKEPACQSRRCKRHGFDPWVKKIPWKRAEQPTPVFLLGKSHGQRSLAGCSPVGLQRVEHDWSVLACTYGKWSFKMLTIAFLTLRLFLFFHYSFLK